jgi:hypothetical protein
MTDGRSPRRPDWLKIRLNTGGEFRKLRSMVDELRLNTVCTEARCPNIYECWSAGTATFMILGETCTRRCGFCNVKSGRPEPGVDADEPRNVGEAVARLRQVLSEHRGHVPVHLTIDLDERSTTWQLGDDLRVTRHPGLFGELKMAFGPDAVSDGTPRSFSAE